MTEYSKIAKISEPKPENVEVPPVAAPEKPPGELTILASLCTADAPDFRHRIADVGAQPFEIFQQVIERDLAGEIP